MNINEKAKLYDDYIRIVDGLQRQNSKLKSEYVVNIPPHIEKKIRENDLKIAEYVAKVEAMMH